MMTSTTARATQLGQGRTLRDVVEHHHALVNEVFCRKIFRQLLASLELQYAMQMPHRAITPDTVVLQENNEPMLLPSTVAASEQTEAADLHALASVVHYAITAEWPPATLLRERQRQLSGYSDSVLGAIDKCLAPSLNERPRTIAQLRSLLGIVSLGPALPGAAPHLGDVPRKQPAASRQGWHHAGLTRLQRWALISAAAGVLLAALVALVALLRSGDPGDNVVLALPPFDRSARGLDPNETLMAPVPHVPAAGAAPTGKAPAVANALPGVPAAQAPPGQAPPARGPQPAAGSPAAAQAAAVSAPRPDAARASLAPTGKTEYKLIIKPWGTLYVDGQDRGVSPPVKRLVLAAGRHTVRIVNPAFPDRVLRIDAGRSPAGRIAHDFSNASR
jgi:hypothetical protein